MTSHHRPSVHPGEAQAAGGCAQDEVLDFSEYTMLYREAWSQPSIRWLFSTVPSAMIFDDHDVHDDWNTSESWIRDMRATAGGMSASPAAIVTYWIYQHLGNLAPASSQTTRFTPRCWPQTTRRRLLREFATERPTAEVGGRLWSFSRLTCRYAPGRDRRPRRAGALQRPAAR